MAESAYPVAPPDALGLATLPSGMEVSGIPNVASLGGIFKEDCVKPPIEYRQPRPASSSGMTPDFGSGNGCSNRPAGAIKKTVLAEFHYIDEAAVVLAHKRSIKAAQMRRYRANKKAKT